MYILEDLFAEILLYVSTVFALFFAIIAIRSARLTKKDFVSSGKNTRKELSRTKNQLAKMFAWLTASLFVLGLASYFVIGIGLTLSVFAPLLCFLIFVNWLIKNMGDFFLQTEFNDEFVVIALICD